MVEQLAYGRWASSLAPETFSDLLSTVAQNPQYREGALALAHDRVSSRAHEWDALKVPVLDLLSDAKLVRARGDMHEYYWIELATKLAHEQPRRIARALFAAQAVRDEENSWFLEHSRAGSVLDLCIEADAAGVWEELHGFLEDPSRAALFTAGFPDGLVERLPHEPILHWVKEQPEPRAYILANLVPKNLEDGTIGAELLSRYSKAVSGVFMSGWASGAWSGEASEHWDGVAAQLRSLARSSSMPGVPSWTEKAAARFTKMADEDRKREAEERVRRG